ncbi:MAG: DUF3868 domain-containing protein [Muribaculaceae bacterium]|nr:DUF3868 domain-containing protein [Muribaculaceae bacterium]
MIKTISKYILAGLAMLPAAGVANAAKDAPLKVYDIDVAVNEQPATVDITIQLNLRDFKLGRNKEVTFTPTLVASDGSQSVELEPVTVCGRNRWYWYDRNGGFANPQAQIYRAGSQEIVTITKTLPFENWMGHSTLEMRQDGATCCGKAKMIPGNLPDGNVLLATINTEQTDLDYDYVFAPPMEDKPVEKSVEGKAFVTFVVNRTELNPDYMNNPAEIRKILNSIDIVKADPDAVITEIHIRGYASPEGPYDNNVRLAKGRTETLANYVNSLYKFKPGIMTTSYDPEDWGGLRAYVKDSLNFNLTNRPGLLAVIDGPLGFDARDAALKSQFPADYEVILRQIYPWLRHSDYAVKYNIKVYTDLDNLMRLYNSDPTKLRPVDFYTIAQQYPTGSEQYLAVMKKAVEVYPDEPMINLNVANLYLMEGDFEAAQSCLLKAGLNPEANFARGVLAAKRGDMREAEKYFTIAKEAGIPQADAYLSQLAVRKTYRPVTIDIPTTK